MPDERDAVVITASRYPHGYASIRSLAARDVHTVAAVDDETLSVTASRYCDESVLVAPPSDLPAYKDALLGLAARPDVRTIVPHRPHDTYLLSKYADEFERHIDVVVPELETLKDVHDRKRLAEAADRAGVAIPETKLLDDVDDWSGNRIVKSRYNLLTDEYLESFEFEDSKIAKSVEHVPPGETPDTDALVEKMNHEPIVQEYVEGNDEYVFGALYDRGEALATFQHRQLRGDSYTGSGGVYRETVDVPALEEAGRAILDELEWHGLACIEYIEDAETGEFSIVEINPRMWQSLGCATHAGADFPHWYWLAATGSADEIEPGYEVGTGTHYLYGELEHLVSVAREESPFVERPSLVGRTGEILRSCYEVPNFDYLHLDDPRPIARQVRNELEGAVTRRFG
ncbi:carboxylate--amine ligase [Natronococcus pandeyae]|uniref:Carboxylate--amine ligase n=1 Tax=Natronococcus pandeyae TaxID=2055836 RepID=A0A8J8PXU0_9EURY|nr:ATP-grasp domain-containing protein [Natronococcus pandeyae]TYL36821.1 carboxylate--amine ligase [Natronococcus pandeyae]